MLQRGAFIKTLKKPNKINTLRGCPGAKDKDKDKEKDKDKDLVKDKEQEKKCSKNSGSGSIKPDILI